MNPARHCKGSSEVINCLASDLQSFSLVVVVMGRSINYVACRMPDVTLLDATLRAHVSDEMKSKMRTVPV
jgi:hypothetical protein